ncbi:hypothetical protein P0D73_45355 [Paraburkholderia sp. RL18-101-BIB-B]|jgi:hypothetical protein|uniref:hypothetical protein n=1 Tax=unclassified Paraburkholderia TaxID=2615204 RepID=UPI0038B7EA73
MNKRLLWFAIVPALLFAGTAAAQYPVLDMVAGKLVQKYQEEPTSALPKTHRNAINATTMWFILLSSDQGNTRRAASVSEAALARACPFAA